MRTTQKQKVVCKLSSYIYLLQTGSKTNKQKIEKGQGKKKCHPRMIAGQISLGNGLHMEQYVLMKGSLHKPVQLKSTSPPHCISCPLPLHPETPPFLPFPFIVAPFCPLLAYLCCRLRQDCAIMHIVSLLWHPILELGSRYTLL